MIIVVVDPSFRWDGIGLLFIQFDIFELCQLLLGRAKKYTVAKLFLLGFLLNYTLGNNSGGGMMPTTLIYALSALNCVAALYFLIHGTKMLFEIRLIHRALRLEVAMSCYFMRTPDFSSQPEWVRLMQEADQIDRRLLKITTFGARQHGELLQSLSGFGPTPQEHAEPSSPDTVQ